MDFPVTLSTLLTVPGIAIFTAIVLLWLNKYIPEDKKLFTNLIALVASEALVLLTTFIVWQWHPSPEVLLVAFLIAFFGTSAECYGYEVVKNAIGFGKPTE